MSILANRDMREVIDEMLLQGVEVDCIITDPPYRTTSRGCAGNSGGMLQKDINKSGKVFTHNNIDITDYSERLYKVLKEGGHLYIMTNNVNLLPMLTELTRVGFHFIKSLIWVKDNKIMGTAYMSQFEYILFFRKGKFVKINNCGTSDVLHFPNKKQKVNGKNLHDTEKPVELMRVLVENSTKVGDRVLDPFMGIGATGVSCADDRIFIGIEIDETYFKIAKDRICGEEDEICQVQI